MAPHPLPQRAAFGMQRRLTCTSVAPSRRAPNWRAAPRPAPAMAPAAAAEHTLMDGAARSAGGLVATLGQQLVAVAAAATLVAGPACAFGPVSVKLQDINVTKVECAAGVATVGGVTFSGASQAAACLDVSAEAVNPSGKPLYNADVFGRVYDSNGEAAIDDTENIRIAYIDEIAPGSSSVHFKLFVPLEQFSLGPLKLVGFKATGFPGKMLPGQGSGVIGPVDSEECELLGDCDDQAAAAMIR